MSDAADHREPQFQIPLDGDESTVLYAERLRDGRIALGTRSRAASDEWVAGEMQILDRRAYLALAAWLAPAVEAAWHETINEHQEDQLHTAFDLYGEGPAAIERLARNMTGEISPWLLVRALTLLINSIGPDARQRLVARLNRTIDPAEESELRRRLADEQEAFAYAVAAAALFDALERGITSGADAAGEE